LLLLLLLLLQVLANLAIIITSEESPAFNAWLTWKDLLHLVDIVCCCAVLFPVRACQRQQLLQPCFCCAVVITGTAFTTIVLLSSQSQLTRPLGFLPVCAA
jgi:hypothetical protein